jgi:hypothetical protein
MNPQIFIKNLKTDFPQYEFYLDIQGKSGWCRIFITHNGISLGRINFCPSPYVKYKLYGIKHYKKINNKYEEKDYIFYNFNTWLKKHRYVEIDNLEEQSIRDNLSSSISMKHNWLSKFIKKLRKIT